MGDNVLIAIIAMCGVVISAVCVLAAAIFAYTAGSKRMDSLDSKVEKIDRDLPEFFGYTSGLKPR